MKNCEEFKGMWMILVEFCEFLHYVMSNLTTLSVPNRVRCTPLHTYLCFGGVRSSLELDCPVRIGRL